MNVDPGRETPLFVQIAESIEDDVFTGLYAEGDRVPSTNEVAALFGINPHTVLKGMNILVDEGIIHKRRGMGMFVSDGALREDPLEAAGGVLRALRGGARCGGGKARDGQGAGAGARREGI